MRIRHRQICLTAAVALLALLMIGCGGFIGNPKKPSGDGETSSNSERVVVFESDDAALMGSSLAFAGNEDEAPMDGQLVVSDDLFDAARLASLGLPANVTVVSPAIGIEIEAELSQQVLDLLYLTIGFNTDIGADQLANLVIVYDTTNASGNDVIGYFDLSFVDGDQAEIPVNQYLTTSLKGGLGKYQVLLLPAPPPSKEKELKDKNIKTLDPAIRPANCEEMRNSTWCSTRADQDLYADGEGTAASPYIICSVKQLNQVRLKLSSHFMQGTSLEADETEDWEGGWEPIGTVGKEKFSGVFDGCGYHVDDIHIFRETENFVGMFGATTSSSIIRNVEVQSSKINGQDFVGGAVGHSCGYLENVEVSGTINGRDFVGMVAGMIGVSDAGDGLPTTPTNCDAVDHVEFKKLEGKGTLNGRDYVGGIAGAYIGANSRSPKSRIFDSDGKAKVTGNDFVGGSFGFLHGAVDKIYTGDVVWGRNHVGGLAGRGYGRETIVNDTHHKGTLTASGINAGGLVGHADSRMQIDSGYSIGNITGTTTVGGVVGLSNAFLLKNVFAQGNVTGLDEVGGLVGNNNPDAQDDGNRIHDCYYRGTVTGIKPTGFVQKIGGLLGTTGISQSITNCYIAGAVTPGSTVPAEINAGIVAGYAAKEFEFGSVFYDHSFAVPADLIGDSDDLPSIDVTGVVSHGTAEMKNTVTFTDAGWDFEHIWKPGSQSFNDGYPFLRAVP